MILIFYWKLVVTKLSLVDPLIAILIGFVFLVIVAYARIISI